MLFKIKKLYRKIKDSYINKSVLKLLNKNINHIKQEYPELDSYNIRIIERKYNTLNRYSISFNQKLKNGFNPFLWGDDDFCISLINSISGIGTIGYGKSEFFNSILARLDTVQYINIKSKLPTNFDLEKHKSYKLFDIDGLSVFIYYKKDDIYITMDSTKHHYYGILSFKKNKLVYFKNSHEHSFQHFKENIILLALCEPSTDDFLEVFGQDISFSEKLVLYKMLEI